jgi:hypothetical protein
MVRRLQLKLCGTAWWPGTLVWGGEALASTPGAAYTPKRSSARRLVKMKRETERALEGDRRERPISRFDRTAARYEGAAWRTNEKFCRDG